MSSGDFLNYTLAVGIIVLVAIIGFVLLQVAFLLRILTPAINEFRAVKNLFKATVFSIVTFILGLIPKKRR